MIWLVEISLFRRLCSGFGLSLSLGPGIKVDFDFVIKNRVRNTSEKSIKISESKFVQDMELVAVPKHVKDDLDAPLEAHVHFQLRRGIGHLQWSHLHGNPLL